MIKVSAKAFRNEALLSSQDEVRLEPKGKMKTRQSRTLSVLSTRKQKQRDTTKIWDMLDMSITLIVVMV